MHLHGERFSEMPLPEAVHHVALDALRLESFCGLNPLPGAGDCVEDFFGWNLGLHEHIPQGMNTGNNSLCIAELQSISSIPWAPLHEAADTGGSHQCLWRSWDRLRWRRVLPHAQPKQIQR